MKVLIVLDKYSDWLETYSFLKDHKKINLSVFLVENERNDLASIKDIYDQIILDNESSVCYHAFKEKPDLFSSVENHIEKLISGDVLMAPFIRYKHLWKLIKKIKKGVKSVHLTEVLPDTFGLLGYRLAFRGKKIKSWLSLPLAYLYAIINKPDICYFPLYPKLKNPFVRNTFGIEIPILNKEKNEFLKKITEGESRPLLISGFGYDLDKMAKELGTNRYIATSKYKEIIIDGISHPLENRICAEEVLLSGLVSEVVGYTSTAMVWSKIIDSNIIIKCFAASEFNRIYGPLYNYLARKSLNTFGIEVHPENKKMINI